MNSDERTRDPRRDVRSSVGAVGDTACDTVPESGLAAPADRLSCARAILHRRRHRLALFDRDMFDEPAWEMLLQLYLSEHARERLTGGALAKLTATPPSTGLRWMRYLIAEGLAAASPGGAALSLSTIRLLPKAREMLDIYLSEVVREAKDGK